jgi:benzodiazapine receptor
MHPIARNSRYRDALGLAAWLVLCFFVATVGAAASIDAGSFYAQLARPGWAPPAAVFGPVWTALYTLMAIAAWLVWRVHRFSGARMALGLFLGQLAANGLWSWVFFKWHQGALATVNVAVLWLLLLVTLVAFWRKSRVAGTLLAPYLLWVTFASALTFAVWRMNPQLLGAAIHAS